MVPCRVDAPVLDPDPLGNLHGNAISIRLGLHFDRVGIKSQLGRNQ